MKSQEIGRVKLTQDVLSERGDEILTPESIDFLERLESEFGERRRGLLEARKAFQLKIDGGEEPNFLASTRAIREGDWCIPTLPSRLLDRRVEITGPPDRKMVINALNSGASCFMADLEDSSTPTWHRVIDGQVNLRDACTHNLRFFDKAKEKHYEVEEEGSTTLLVRPRGLHLEEKHMIGVDGRPLSGSLVDFGLFFFHNALDLAGKDEGPYFYLPKLEHHLEARWWHDVFVFSEDFVGLRRGTTRATVLVETLPAGFQMDEILHSLGVYAAGLNCGRWDYLFSLIKTYRSRKDKVLPDRSCLTMESPSMRAYSRLAIETCHKRGALCIGGMAAQIPIKGDDEANEAALAKVRRDKEREFADGHDGSWVAHPGLVGMVKEIFSRNLPSTHQLEKRLEGEMGAEELLKIPEGDVTEEGLRQNVRVSVRYIESWLRGVGCVPIFHLMEDAATAEISRAQVWQWVRHGVRLQGGDVVDASLVKKIVEEEREAVEREMGDSAKGMKFGEASALFAEMATSEDLDDFLTLKAYDMLVAGGM